MNHLSQPSDMFGGKLVGEDVTSLLGNTSCCKVRIKFRGFSLAITYIWILPFKTHINQRIFGKHNWTKTQGNHFMNECLEYFRISNSINKQATNINQVNINKCQPSSWQSQVTNQSFVKLIKKTHPIANTRVSRSLWRLFRRSDMDHHCSSC